MKKMITFLFASLMLLLSGTIANAQSKIPGSLDLSTTVVDAGTGTLHDGAGWDGSKIDWMTKGNTATIQFENTKADTKYNIISYGGTNQSQVVVNFKITDANGTEFYNQTTEPYTSGGFGDKKPNKSLPTTNPMPAGNYTLTLTYDNLEEGASLEVNITQIDFEDADAQQQGDDDPAGKPSLNIPGVLDGNQAVITKNCSWDSTPSCDESNCFNWVGNGDEISFAITNTKTSAYAISFDTATPCEPVTIDFLITDANGQTVYGQTANVVCTGENGGDWAFKPEGHNTSLPNTDVLPEGNYTLKLTFHQGTNYENFTTNLKDITFTAVGGSNGDSFDVDLSTVDTSESKGGNLHYMADGDENCPRLDYPGSGSIAKFEIDIAKESAYKITFNYASPMDKMFMVWTLTDANGKEVFNQKFDLEPTGAPGDFWTIYKDFDGIPETPVLPAGKYTLRMYYNITTDGEIIPAWYDGSENASFHSNIKRITFTAVGAAKENVVFLHGENFDKANSTNDLYQFTDAQGFTLTMNNRDVNKTPCNWTDPNGNAYTDGINFKNNDPGTINIPEGYKVTKLEIGGCSQSDAGNLCYLYTVDKDDVNFFTDAIGQNVKENSDIQSKATYPILADGTAPLFATLDFSAAPATKSIKVVLSGNNQENVWFKVYYNNGEEPVESQTLYSWTGAEAGAIETGGKAVASDGESVNYKNGDNWTIRINKKKENIDTDNVTITLDEALQAGDVIAITAYRNKDTDANGTLYMLFENGAEIDEGDEKVWNNIHADYGQEPNTRTYTIQAEAGSKSFKIARSAASTNVLITKIEITRGGTTGINEIERSTSDSLHSTVNSQYTYNLRGQRVDANYKGIVIKNGKKYYQR